MGRVAMIELLPIDLAPFESKISQEIPVPVLMIVPVPAVAAVAESHAMTETSQQLLAMVVRVEVNAVLGVAVVVFASGWPLCCAPV